MRGNQLLRFSSFKSKINFQKIAENTLQKYPDNDNVKAICELLINHFNRKINSDECEKSLLSICTFQAISLKTQVKNTSTSTISFAYREDSIRTRASLLLNIVKNHHTLLKHWPMIKTLEELVIAQQKLDYIQFIQKRAISFKKQFENNKIECKNWDDIFNDLSEQIKESDPNVLLETLLDEDSFFSKTPIKRRAPHGKFESVKISVYNEKTKNTILQEVTIKNALSLLTQNYTVTNISSMLEPAAVVGQIPQIDLIEDFWRKKNLSLHMAAIEMKHNYLKLKRRKHREDINDLITLITNIINNRITSAISHHESYLQIITVINEAYIKEHDHFTKPSLFSWWGKSNIEFNQKLTNNDNEFCYPRMLKAILDKEKNQKTSTYRTPSKRISRKS